METTENLDPDQNDAVLLEEYTQKLRQSEANLAAMIDASSESAFLIDTKGMVIACNRVGADRVGKRRETVIGQSLFDFVSPDVAAARRPYVNRVIETGKALEFEDCRDGRVLSHHLHPVLDDNGNVIRVAIFGHDITRYRHAEQLLAENEKRFRQMFMNAPMPYQSLDEQGNFLDVNQAFLDVLGYTREDLLGHNFGEILHPDWVDHFRENFPRFKAIGEILGVEFEMVKKDGSTILVFFNGRIQRDDENRFQRTHCIFQDITDRRRVEVALHASEEKYRRITENISDVVWIADLNLKMTYITPSVERLVGEPVATRLERTIEEKFPPDSLNRLYALFTEELEIEKDPDCDKNRSRLIEVQNYRADGSTMWVSMHMSFVRDESGNPVGIQGVMRDISERKQMEETQQKLQKRLLQAVEMARLSYWEYDVVKDLFIFDDTFYKIFRVTVDQVGGYTMSSKDYADRFVYPDDRRLVAEEVGKAIATTDPLYSRQLEHRILYADGTVGHISVRFNIIKDESGKTVKTYGINQDITERKQAEQALINSERKWRNILVNTPQIGISLDPQARILFANAHFLKVTGWTEQEVLGQDWFGMFIPEPVREEIRQYFNNVMNCRDTLGFMSYENEILTRTGDIRNIAWSNVLTKDAQGDIIDVTCLGVDQTERKRAEESLRESEEKYRLLTEKIPDIVWMADLELRTVYVSPSVKKVLGFTQEERMRQTVDQQLTSDSLAHGLDIFAKELNLEKQPHKEPERSITLELEYFHKDGSTRWMETIVSGIRNNHGVLTGIHGVSRDITERKQAEQKHEKVQAQLLQSQKMESVGRLAGGVAHDFNNMLGVILGYTEIALEGVCSGHPLFDSLKEIQNAAERSAHLTRQLLAFARKQIVSPKVLDLNDTVEGMLQMLRRLIGENIDLRWMPEGRLWPVRIDPGQMDQILVNLCVNARDAIAGVGQVTIKTGIHVFDPAYGNENLDIIPGEYVLLSVNDNGCGMDAETREHLFEPFFTTKEIGQGTGLGLATVYGIVKQNNGLINVSSEPGQGTTFNIYLPRHVADSAGESADGPSAQLALGSETVLLVEDEPAILSLGKVMLERLGYRVLAASNPEGALDLARKKEETIDLLITDVIMPTMNGWDMAERLKSLYPDLRVLFMSGYSADVISHRGVLGDGVNFLQKPFSMTELAARVRQALDG